METLSQISIIDDEHKMYSINPICTNTWCLHEHYEYSEFFPDILRPQILGMINGILVLVFGIGYNIDTYYEKIKIKDDKIYVFILLITHMVYIVICIGMLLYYVNMKQNICDYKYDCEEGHNGNTNPSIILFNLYNDECPTVTDLIYEYEGQHPELIDDDCMRNGECCSIDVLCNNLMEMLVSFEEFNTTNTNRNSGVLPRETGINPLHINFMHECNKYPIEELIYSSMKVNRNYYYNMLTYIITSYITLNGIMLMIIILKNRCKDKKTVEHHKLSGSA